MAGVCPDQVTALSTTDYVRRFVRAKEYVRAQKEEETRRKLKSKQRRLFERMKAAAREDVNWIASGVPRPSLEHMLHEMARDAEFSRALLVAQMVIDSECTQRLSFREEEGKAEDSRAALQRASEDADEVVELRAERVLRQRAVRVAREASVREAEEDLKRMVETDNAAKQTLEHAADEAERRVLEAAKLLEVATSDHVEATRQAAAQRREAAIKSSDAATAKADAMKAQLADALLTNESLKEEADVAEETARHAKFDAREASDTADEAAYAANGAPTMDGVMASAAAVVKELTEKEEEYRGLASLAITKKDAAKRLAKNTGETAAAAAEVYTKAAITTEAASIAYADAASKAYTATVGVISTAEKLAALRAKEMSSRAASRETARKAVIAAEAEVVAQTSRQGVAKEAMSRAAEQIREMAALNASVTVAASVTAAAEEAERLAAAYEVEVSRSAEASRSSAQAAWTAKAASLATVVATESARKATDAVMQRELGAVSAWQALEDAVVATHAAAKDVAEWRGWRFTVERAKVEALEARLEAQSRSEDASELRVKVMTAKEDMLHVTRCAERFDQESEIVASRAEESRRAAQRLLQRVAAESAPQGVLTEGSPEADERAAAAAQVARQIQAEVLTKEVAAANARMVRMSLCREIAQTGAKRAVLKEKKQLRHVAKLEQISSGSDESEARLAACEKKEKVARARADRADRLRTEAVTVATLAKRQAESAVSEGDAARDAAAAAAIAADEMEAKVLTARAAVKEAETAFEAIDMVVSTPTEAEIAELAASLLPDLEATLSLSNAALAAATSRVDTWSTDLEASSAAAAAAEEASRLADATVRSAAKEVERASAVASTAKESASEATAASRAAGLAANKAGVAAAAAAVEATADAAVGMCAAAAIETALTDALEEAAILRAADIEKAKELAAVEAEKEALRQAMGGYAEGDLVYVHDLTRTRKGDGKRVVHGSQGEVLSLVQDQVLAVRFADGHKGHFDHHCSVESLSYEPAPRLAGDFQPGDTVYLHPPARQFAEGVVLRGEILGPPGPYATAFDHAEQMVAVSVFPAPPEAGSTTGRVAVEAAEDIRALYVSSLSRSKPAAPPSGSRKDTFRRTGSVRL